MADKKEIHTYDAAWPTYAMNWSNRPDKKFRLAIGSFIEEYNNKIDIVQLDEETNSFVSRAKFDHPFPATKIMWVPDKTGSKEDLLATSGDSLRVWKVDKTNNAVKQLCSLNNSKTNEFGAPLTSFDWNETDPNIIGTSSVDTTCTIWNIETRQVKSQLIAHDKEVYDIAFAQATDQVLASAGADGSVRMFDLRSLEHSTVIYEAPELVPVLRLGWNKHDHNYVAAFMMEQHQVVILDVRAPSVPVAELFGHTQNVNALAWAPHSSCHLCTAGDDRQALLWDLTPMPKPINEPVLAYNADSEVNSLQWSGLQPDWMAITCQRKLQILRI